MGGEHAGLLPLVDAWIDLAVDQRLPGLAQRFVLGSELHLYILATPKVMGLSGRTIDSRAIESVKARIRRVSRGSMMPSSHRCAVPNSAVDSRSNWSTIPLYILSICSWG